MKKCVLIFCIAILFTACFNSRTLEEEKFICLKEDKKFYITEVIDDSTGKIKPKVVCK